MEGMIAHAVALEQKGGRGYCKNEHEGGARAREAGRRVNVVDKKVRPYTHTRTLAHNTHAPRF